MTGFPDDPAGPRDPSDRLGPPGPWDGPRGEGLDGSGPDPVERLLHRPGGYLPAPPGAFERIRRAAARRRRTRALAGGAVVAAMVTGSVYLAGALGPHGSGEVVAPPASSSRTTTPAPATAATPPATSAPPPPTVRPTPGGGTQPAPSAPGATGGPSSGPTTPPAPGPTSQCTADQLSASLVDGDAAAGSVYHYLVLTNHSSTTCHLTGFPGLSLLDPDGRQLGAPATRERIPYESVVLAPGGTASDTVRTVNHQGSCLPASAQLRIYPPGSRASLVVPGEITNCDGTFVITPFAAGSTGNPPA